MTQSLEEEVKEYYKQEEENMEKITLDSVKITELKTKFYQTPYAEETICIMEDPDGSVSIGLARAGRIDIEERKVTSERGMMIAEGRAIKAMTTKGVFVKKNYLRGLYAERVETPVACPVDYGDFTYTLADPDLIETTDQNAP